MDVKSPLTNKRNSTDGTIEFSYIDVVKTYPDEPLEELACDYLSDMQGWLAKDIKVVLGPRIHTNCPRQRERCKHLLLV